MRDRSEAVREELNKLARQLTHGCGDGYCVIVRPAGMATNARCLCTPVDISKRLLDLAVYVERLDRNWRIKP